MNKKKNEYKRKMNTKKIVDFLFFYNINKNMVDCIKNTHCNTMCIFF
jgi:hypothetical protein